MKKYILSFFILILFAQFLFAQEESEKHPILTKRFQIEAGVYLPSKNIKIGVDGSTSTPNDDINFNESFGLDDNEATLFLNLEWRFAKKWKLSGEYFAVKSSKTAMLEEDIVFEDITFEEGTNIKGGFGLDMYRIHVGRSFFRALKHELGASLGVHALNTTAFVEGDVFTSEGDASFERRSVNAVVPLPNIGLWYFYTPNTKWALLARIDWFGITVGEYSGSLWNIAPAVKYQIWENVGVRADYRYFYVKANVNKSDWTGQFEMSFSGPMLAVYANF
jgi:hypothetical protein